MSLEDSIELFRRAITESDDHLYEKLDQAKRTMSARQWNYAMADFIKKLRNELNLDR